MQYFLVFLLLMTLGLIILGLISPVLLGRILKRKMSRKDSVLGLGIIAIILFVVIGITAPERSKEENIDTKITQNPTEASPVASPIPTAEPSASPDYLEAYKVKVNRDRANVINYKLLISPEDVVLAGDIATSFFKKCTKNCTVDLYDDEKALNLHEQYDQMYMKSETTQEDLKSWEKKNYVYVADHYVGRIDFDARMYNDYPLKDWYYEELGGKE